MKGEPTFTFSLQKSPESLLCTTTCVIVTTSPKPKALRGYTICQRIAY